MTTGTPPRAALDGEGGLTRVAVGALVLGTAAIAVAYASAFRAGGAPAWAAWCMALGVPVDLVATMMLGASRRGRLPGVVLGAFLLVGAMLAGGFALALALPGDLGAAEPLWLGLPRRAAVVVYGIGLLPVIVLPVVYAWSFDAQTLREEDLAEVVEEGRRRRAAVARQAGRDDAEPARSAPAVSATRVGEVGA